MASGLPQPDGTSLPLASILTALNNQETQENALKHLGIEITGSKLTLTFLEKGKQYDPETKRTATLKEASTQTVTLTINLSNPPTFPLKIHTINSPTSIGGINFAGTVTYTTPQGIENTIPLTGRGTIALEGRTNDPHAGYSTGDACAAFQSHAALMLATAAAVGATKEDFKLIENILLPVCGCFHGREDALQYSIKLAADPQYKETYPQYMAKKYPVGAGRSQFLQDYLSTGSVPIVYYKKAVGDENTTGKLTLEEVECDLKDAKMKNTPELYSDIRIVEMALSKSQEKIYTPAYNSAIRDSWGDMVNKNSEEKSKEKGVNKY